TATGKLVLLDNERGGRFVAKAQPGDFGHATTLLAFDANNDGRVDLLIGHMGGATLLLADKNGAFPADATRQEMSTDSIVRQMGFFDYDNDGWMDVWLLGNESLNPKHPVSERPLRLFRNVNGQRFQETTEILPVLSAPITAVSVSDFDNDGALDLLIAGPKGVVGLRNDGRNQNNCMNLRVRAREIKGESEGGQAAKVNY